jgi:hypothetical protein
VKDEEIALFATTLERIDWPHQGPAYRCAAYLNDGLYLPCVVIASRKAATDLAVRRFDETRVSTLGAFRLGRRRAGRGYREVVSTFVASGNRVNGYDIARLEKSRFAIPLARLAEVHGETSMSWTQFTAVMRDGREYSFGTTFLMEFFAMPEGYSGDDIVAVVSHKRGEGELFRERPFFTCRVDGLE